MNTEVLISELLIESLKSVTAQRDDLLDALNNLLAVIDKAGLQNLSNGVQLGQMSWYVKANDAVDYSKSVIAKCETTK